MTPREFDAGVVQAQLHLLSRSSFDLAAKAGLIDGDLSRRLQPSVGLRNVLAQ